MKKSFLNQCNLFSNLCNHFQISFTLILLATVLIIISCKKKEEPQPTSPSVSLTLTADKTTMKLGEDTKITAATNATNATFSWSVNTSSTIVGSGSEVRLWGSCPSCTGANEVTCSVTDNDTHQWTKKKITITIQ